MAALPHVPVLALGALTAGCALVNWWSVSTRRTRTEWWSKLLTLAAMCATAAVAGATQTTPGRWLLVALALGLLGDFALLGSTLRRFLAGVAAFLVGHLAYVACFLTLGQPWPWWAWGGLVAGVGLGLVTREVAPAAWRVVGPALAGPLVAYSLVIAAMLVVAWGTGLVLVAAGALVFAVSDTLIALSLARHRFERPRGVDSPAVMVTYHLGQALIVAGVLWA
jgi:uncharacterized membrane protein YhhN